MSKINNNIGIEYLCIIYIHIRWQEPSALDTRDRWLSHRSPTLDGTEWWPSIHPSPLEGMESSWSHHHSPFWG